MTKQQAIPNQTAIKSWCQEVLDFTVDSSGCQMELLGNFADFLGFDFGIWTVDTFSCAVIKILPISAWVWTYFFLSGEEI